MRILGLVDMEKYIVGIIVFTALILLILKIIKSVKGKDSCGSCESKKIL